MADQESDFENRLSANHDLIDAYSTRIVEVHRDITQNKPCAGSLLAKVESSNAIASARNGAVIGIRLRPVLLRQFFQLFGLNP